jgi:mono/diheme cytochrome c family protein
VHGIERAMGVSRSRLPWLVLGAGLTGGLVALGMQWWTNAVDYPYLISGKPFFSLPANIPVIFEVIVLFSALTAFFGNLVLSKLPRFGYPAFSLGRFKKVTCDGFFISIDAADPAFDELAARALLESAGATGVEVVEGAPSQPKLPVGVVWTVAVLGCLALLPPLLTAWYRSSPKRHPRLHLIQDMDFQPKYKAQAANPWFEDRRAMRPPVAGTVAVGELNEDDHLYRGKVDGGWARSLPMPPTESLMARGQERFQIYCTPCHGYDGAGGGIVSQRAMQRLEPDWATPVSLHSNSVRQQADGQIFRAISDGVRKMPAYASQIEPADRWAIVFYVRALQLSQNALADDVPESIRQKLQ